MESQSGGPPSTSDGSSPTTTSTLATAPPQPPVLSTADILSRSSSLNSSTFTETSESSMSTASSLASLSSAAPAPIPPSNPPSNPPSTTAPSTPGPRPSLTSVASTSSATSNNTTLKTSGSGFWRSFVRKAKTVVQRGANPPLPRRSSAAASPASTPPRTLRPSASAPAVTSTGPSLAPASSSSSSIVPMATPTRAQPAPAPSTSSPSPHTSLPTAPRASMNTAASSSSSLTPTPAGPVGPMPSWLKAGSDRPNSPGSRVQISHNRDYINEAFPYERELTGAAVATEVHRSLVDFQDPLIVSQALEKDHRTAATKSLSSATKAEEHAAFATLGHAAGAPHHHPSTAARFGDELPTPHALTYKWYTQPWTTVKHPVDSFSPAALDPSAGPSHIFHGRKESSPERKPLSPSSGPASSDPLALDLLKPSDSNLRAENRAARLDRKVPLAVSFDPTYDFKDIATQHGVPEADPKPWSTMPEGTKILVETPSIAFEFTAGTGEAIEPFFFSFALFDIASKRRISEWWHTSANPPHTTELLAGSTLPAVGTPRVSSSANSSMTSFTSLSAAQNYSANIGSIGSQGSITSVTTVNSNSNSTGSSNKLSRPGSTLSLSSISSGASNASTSVPVQRAVFTLTAPSQGVHLIARVHRVLQGDPETTLHAYANPEAPLKDQAEFLRSTREQIKRLAPLRQPMVWGALPLFNGAGGPLLKSRESKELAFEFLLRDKSEADAVLANSLKEALKDVRGGRRFGTSRKFIPGTLKVAVTMNPPEDVLGLRLDPSLRPVASTALGSQPPAPTREIGEIKSYLPPLSLTPHTSYVHDATVAPLSANLSSLRKTSARNIAVRIQLRTVDSTPDPSAQSHKAARDVAVVFYDQWGTPRFVKAAYTSVTYHSKTPSWTEDFKLALPPVLSPQHHFLFTFYHVSCKKPVARASSSLTPWSDTGAAPIAYAFLPILPEGGTIAGVEQSLPLTTALRPGYLHEDVAAELPWLDNGKALFHLKFVMQSSLYPQHPTLDKFLRMYGSTPAVPVEVIKALDQVPPGSLVKWLPMVYNRLFEVMCTSSILQIQQAFNSIVNLTYNLQDEPRAALIHTYTTHVFTNVPGAEELVYDQLCQQWLIALSAPLQSLSKEVLLDVSWFLFDIVTRSMALKVLDGREQVTSSDSPTRPDWFSQSYVRLIKKLVGTMTALLPGLVSRQQNKLARRVNSALAVFIRGLFDVFHRGHAIDLVQRYVVDVEGSSNPQCASEIWKLKFNFLAIIADHNSYVQLNLPVPYSLGLSGSALTSMLTQSHPLASLLIQETVAVLHSSDEQVHRKGLTELVSVMTKHSYDERWAGNPDLAARVAGMYFPLITLLVDQYDDLTTWRNSSKTAERRLLAVAVVWVLDGMDRSLLRSWWTKESVKRNNVFLAWLRFCLDALAFDPTVARAGGHGSLSRRRINGLGSSPPDRNVALPVSPNKASTLKPSTSLKALRGLTGTVSAASGLSLAPTKTSPRPSAKSIFDNNDAVSPGSPRSTSSGAPPADAATWSGLNTSSTGAAGGASSGLASSSSTPALPQSTLPRGLMSSSSTASLSSAGLPPKDGGEASSGVTTPRQRGKLGSGMLKTVAKGGSNLWNTFSPGQLRKDFSAFSAVDSSVRPTLTTNGVSKGWDQDSQTAGEFSFAILAVIGDLMLDHADAMIAYMKASDGSGPVATIPDSVINASAPSGENLSGSSPPETPGRGVNNAQPMMTLSPPSHGTASGRSSANFGSNGLIGSNSRHSMGTLNTSASNLSTDKSLGGASSGILKVPQSILASSSLSERSLFPSILGLLSHIARSRQSEFVLESTLTLLREELVPMFSSVLFTSRNPSAVFELAKIALELGNSRQSCVRAQATALLFVLIKYNQAEVGNFDRVSIQATNALSRLMFDLHEDTALKRSLGALAGYALHDFSTPGLDLALGPKTGKSSVRSGHRRDPSAKLPFTRAVQGLSVRLTMIVVDTIKTRHAAASAGPERLADLYNAIAESYRQTPVLRVTWLDQLGRFHATAKHYAEAAQCFLRISALMAEYLAGAPGSVYYGLIDFDVFARVCPGLHETLDLGESEEEQSTLMAEFSREKLRSNLRMSIGLLKKAQLFEYAHDVYRILLRIYEHRHDYGALIQAFADEKEIWTQIQAVDASGDRLLGTYYRVGFYGASFGEELDGREFIYKEPKLTHLYDFAPRLRAQFGGQLGKDIKIIPDRKDVDRSKLDPDAAYLQITFVSPYFSDDEVASRDTYFERNTALPRFMYETRFSPTNDPKAGITEQWMRKTVLYVDQPFPCTLKRQAILRREEFELSPIEAAAETIQGQAKKIGECADGGGDNRNLSQVLQGTLMLQVHGGSLEIAKLFLTDPSQWDARGLTLLRGALATLLATCRHALNVHRRRMTAGDSPDFHEGLEKGYLKLSIQLEPYVQGGNAVHLMSIQHALEGGGDQASRRPAAIRSSNELDDSLDDVDSLDDGENNTSGAEPGTPTHHGNVVEDGPTPLVLGSLPGQSPKAGGRESGLDADEVARLKRLSMQPAPPSPKTLGPKSESMSSAGGLSKRSVGVVSATSPRSAGSRRSVKVRTTSVRTTAVRVSSARPSSLAVSDPSAGAGTDGASGMSHSLSNDSLALSEMSNMTSVMSRSGSDESLVTASEGLDGTDGNGDDDGDRTDNDSDASSLGGASSKNIDLVSLGALETATESALSPPPPRSG